MSQESRAVDVTTQQVAHELYINEVLPHLAHTDAVAALFERGEVNKDFTFSGEKLVLFGDLHAADGAMATSGWEPDHVEVDVTRFETTPARMYRTIALDNLSAALGQGQGMAEAYVPRLRKQATASWERMNTRHVHGDSNATIAIIGSRTSDTVYVLKDGLGHTGTSPSPFIDKNSYVSILDPNDSFASLGSAKISTYNATTKTLTLATAVTGVAAEDVLVFATTHDESAANYEVERGNAPNGLGNIVDPDENQTAFLGVTLANEPRFNPLYKTSADFGEVEVMEFVGEIEANGEFEATPENFVLAGHRALEFALAKTLTGFTQIQQKGAELAGGWSAVRIGPWSMVKSGRAIHDVLYGLTLADLCIADLGDPTTDAGDGLEWTRMDQYDGRKLRMSWFAQRFPRRRNRLGALTGISGINADQFTDGPR